MTTLREAAQAVLARWDSPANAGCADLMEALRTALAESVQKPVAWMYDFPNPDDQSEVIRNWVTQEYAEIVHDCGVNVRPLYTHPADDTALLRQALEALENLGRFDSRPSSIWTYFYASAKGDFVNLREFREKAEPAINALRERLEKDK